MDSCCLVFMACRLVIPSQSTFGEIPSTCVEAPKGEIFKEKSKVKKNS